jgi:EpsG family
MIYITVFALMAAVMGAQYRRISAQALGVIFAMLLATMAALRGPQVAEDFLVYETWYTYRGDDAGFLERPVLFEALYFLLNDAFASALLPFRVFVWVLAFLAVFLKLNAIQWFSRSGWATAAGVLTYTLTFFLLHEFTQIRAGLAVAIVFYGLRYLYRGEHLKFLGAIVLAIGFHSSALIFLVFLLPVQGRAAGWIDKVLLGLTTVLFAFAARGIAPGSVLLNLLAGLDPRIALYVTFSETTNAEAANPLAVPALMLFVLALSLARVEIPIFHAPRGGFRLHWRGGWRRRLTETPVKQSPVPLSRDVWMLVLGRRGILFGLIFLISLAPVKELALRLFEINIVFLPLMATCLFASRRKYFAKCMVMGWVLATAYVYVVRDEGLVRSYSVFFL